jgi:uncharacterized protein YndB with AHSA1/START domain
VTNDEKKISASTQIAASPATVFAIVADPAQHPRIDGSGSVREVIRSDGPITAKGQSFRVDMKMFGLPYKIENRVVEFAQDQQIAWRHFGGHRWRYEITPTADGCEVTETFDYSMYPAPGRFFIELAGFPQRNRSGIEGTLERLKAAAETDAHESA